MILGKIAEAPDGSTWVQVGYSSPRRRTCGATYRYVRTRDGARIRVPSSKFYKCQVSKENWKSWTSVAAGHDEAVTGGANLESDRLRMEEVIA